MSHRDTVLRYLRAHTPDDDEALDLVATTFERAWVALQGPGLPEPPLPWLLRVAHNAAIDRSPASDGPPPVARDPPAATAAHSAASRDGGVGSRPRWSLPTAPGRPARGPTRRARPPVRGGPRHPRRRRSSRAKRGRHPAAHQPRPRTPPENSTMTPTDPVEARLIASLHAPITDAQAGSLRERVHATLARPAVTGGRRLTRPRRRSVVGTLIAARSWSPRPPPPSGSCTPIDPTPPGRRPLRTRSRAPIASVPPPPDRRYGPSWTAWDSRLDHRESGAVPRPRAASRRRWTVAPRGDAVPGHGR